ncbi:ABC transporter permease [Paenibacillus sp. Y412MC10]|uniref:ABC transporter permease n=1 Tax=Geobacillus sp. (strain Y412MC10) TaxID=481743 RepID=UPI0011AB378C|nr:ABC transporter permease [Paenibacillus sp. Y412MC10]
MNNAQSALKMAAGFFLVIALITIAVVMFISAQEATKSAQENFSDIQTELSQTAFNIYNGTTVSGSQVTNAIRKYKGKGQFGVQVKTGKNPAGSWYSQVVNITGSEGTTGYGSITGEAATGTLAKAADESSNDYINPSGKFDASVVVDNSGVVRGLIFKQK